MRLGREVAEQCEGQIVQNIRNADMILGQQEAELLNAVKQNSDMITLELQKHDTGSRTEI